MKKRFRITFLFTILWMIVIFCFSAQPGEDSSKVSGFFVDLLSFLFMENEFLMERASFLVRKCAHMSEYALLAILFYHLFMNTSKFVYAYPLALLCSFLYACSDEFHQLFVPGRAGMFQDVLIDTTGAFLGLLAVFLLTKLWLKNKKKTSALA